MDQILLTAGFNALILFPTVAIIFVFLYCNKDLTKFAAPPYIEYVHSLSGKTTIFNAEIEDRERTNRIFALIETENTDILAKTEDDSNAIVLFAKMLLSQNRIKVDLEKDLIKNWAAAANLGKKAIWRDLALFVFSPLLKNANSRIDINWIIDLCTDYVKVVKPLDKKGEAPDIKKTRIFMRELLEGLIDDE
ncbi:hypothetical protein MHBO_001154 [Bonamia ostreae]|uniref:Uncharacterized protein n=1 Tax=Bonamia ostreae TaxID=126728 RepID=A0ABV2AIH2_9EUKA